VGLSRERRFTNHHRVLNRAAWDPRAAAGLLFGLLMPPSLQPVPWCWASTTRSNVAAASASRPKGIYRDPVRSSDAHFVEASGLRWMSLMLLAPIPSERACREKARRHKAAAPCRTATRRASASLAAWPRPRADRRQRLLRPPAPRRDAPRRRHGAHPPVSRRSALRTRPITTTRYDRTSAHQGRPAAHPVRRPRGREHALAGDPHARIAPSTSP
jgi:hypothetical protein